MKHSKHCESDHIKQLGFSIDCDDQGIPIGICDKRAKHSIISKESDTIGGHIKQIFRFCDEHFYSLKESYDNTRFQQLKHEETHKEDLTCPDCGKRGKLYYSKLRFRENRL